MKPGHIAQALLPLNRYNLDRRIAGDSIRDVRYPIGLADNAGRGVEFASIADRQAIWMKTICADFSDCLSTLTDLFISPLRSQEHQDRPAAFLPTGAARFRLRPVTGIVKLLPLAALSRFRSVSYA